MHAGVLVRECWCAGQGGVSWLAPHTILCPHMGRNFLEIVRYHRSRCAWHVSGVQVCVHGHMHALRSK